MLLKGKPVPPELQPLKQSTFQRFLQDILSERSVAQTRQKSRGYAEEWPYYPPQRRLDILNELHDILFADCFPRPICQVTFGRVRFTASFHSDTWQMRFSENYFGRPFLQIVKTWMHESYHAFLHFLSLRLNPQDTAKVIKPPQQIIGIANRHPLSGKQDTPEVMMAEKNLLGMMDRYLTDARSGNVGLDSYYLNVEINVETLTELTYKRVLPGVPYKRSYRTAEEYIQRRFQGYAPVYAY